MRVRINPGKAGVITVQGHVDAGAEYDGEDAALLVAIGKAVEIDAAPKVVVVEPPDEIVYESPSGKTIKTRAKKAGRKRKK